MVPTERTRFKRHRFVLFSTVKSLSTFGNILPATAELHPNRYALFTGALGFMKTEASLTLEESISGAEACMWSDLTLETDVKVLAQGVARGAATLIPDGLYFYDLDPTKGGACWILETDACHFHQAIGCL